MEWFSGFEALADRNMFSTVIVGIIRHALLLAGIGALGFLNTALWGG